MNKLEERYINDLIKNHSLDTESDDAIDFAQKGGSGNQNPDGGFPPIFICEQSSGQDIEENKNREYSKHKNAISIKQIMEKRRNTTPFITTTSK